MYYLLTESWGINTSSPTSMACSSSFSMTSPRYLTYRSVMMAAALACSFLGEDCLVSASGSLTTTGNLVSFLEDCTEDSEETLMSEDRKLFKIGLISSWGNFLETAPRLFFNLPITETPEVWADEMPWKVFEEWTFWALVLCAVASCSSPIES